MSDDRKPRVADPLRPAGAEGTHEPARSTTRAEPSKRAGEQNPVQGLLPALSLPTGGGAIRGMGEKFTTNPVTGTGSFSVPIPTSPGRGGFELALALAYDSGAGNGPFGIGWQLSAAAITRKTDKGLPRYLDDDDQEDVFIVAGAEDLVPLRTSTGLGAALDERELGDFTIRRYRPRTEGGFARIERWSDRTRGEQHWRMTDRDNVLHVFGRSSAARVVGPEDERRVFSWLLEETRDDRGNVTHYDYKQEDGVGVDPGETSEAHRFSGIDSDCPHFLTRAQRYLKRIRYGNRTPLAPDAPLPSADQFMFEVVFDYGEHEADAPSPDEVRPWSRRSDPFSSYRATFELRSYRLCRRVLMFHRFMELGSEPYLVRSTDFDYDEGATFSYLRAVTQAGYERASGSSRYVRATLPPLELAYSRPKLHDTLHMLSHESLQGIPFGVDGVDAQWVDLDSEGIPGVLIPNEGAWFYKTNCGGGVLAPPRLERSLPAPAELRGGVQQLVDLAGDGRLDLVQYSPPLAGFFEREPDRHWAPFRAFAQLPNLDWNDPNLRFLDLDGDGLPDVLITEDEAIVWYRARAKQGFEPAQRVRKPKDEARGPALVFADGTEAIHLADMSGDGLSDLVRVRNSEVCYWPNLGYGRFGRKVTLSSATRLDTPDKFAPERVRLADVDGSGVADLIYLGGDGVRLYFNQSGNSLGAAVRLTALPPVDQPSSFQVVDLLGQGTACLVWSSPLPGASAHPIRYVDILGGQKPHVLISAINNLGAETRIGYAPSTKFYLEDKAQGRPWLTRLAYPVHVVERIEHLDHISNTRLVTRFAYHHGFYDGYEREFRGFARVDQWDAESFSGDKGMGLFAALPYDRTPDEERLDLPPVRTVSWFHTGAWLEREQLELALAREFYSGDPLAPTLPAPALPTGLSTSEEREAARALRGQLVRQEIYAEDGSAQAEHPYSVSLRTCAIRLLQRAHGTAHSSFFVHPQSSVTLHYERNPADPRMQQELVLVVDEFGNISESAVIGYPRRQPEYPEQARLWATWSLNRVANVTTESCYRLGVPLEMASRELTGLAKAEAQVFSPEEMRSVKASASELPFEGAADYASLQTRLIQREQRLYYRDDLSGPLPFGSIGTRALPYEVHKQAFTPGLLDDAYGMRVDGELLEREGGYLLQDGVWWAVSGRAMFDPERFYLPVEAIDRFGNRYQTRYDAYALLALESIDPAGNRVSVGERDAEGEITRSGIDYRALAPVLITDPNRNRTAVALDALGMPVATALMGKASAGEGDSLDDPTTRLEYDLHRYRASGGKQPAFVHTFAREQHGAANPHWQEAFGYSDGSGREVMKKVQAESGPVPRLPEGGGRATEVEQRWIGTGRTVFDNKGNAIKQYEPFFATGPDYETERELVESGVTPVLRYDPLGRLIRTDFPDGTHAQTFFDPWQHQIWDQNDSIQGTPWLARKQAGSADERRCAALALAHARTPTREHLDSLGRPFLRVADNGPDGLRATRTELDVQGQQRSVVDARGNAIVRQLFDMLGRAVRVVRADAGDSDPTTRRRTVGVAEDGQGGRTLSDCTNAPLRAWTERGFLLRTEYDVLRRAVALWVRDEQGEKLVQHTRYGDHESDAEERNLRTRPQRVLDGAGQLLSERFDFKGNLTEVRRRLAKEYKTCPNWSALVGQAEQGADGWLEPESFVVTTSYDALGRVTSSTNPDGSETKPAYNRRNLLASVQVRLRNGHAWTSFVDSIAYNARGQRQRAQHGNKTATSYTYDAHTFRLLRQRTVRTLDDEVLQDLAYALDPVGNVCSIQDAVSYGNPEVSATGFYEYDALYQLSKTEGREHPGQQPSDQDSADLGLPSPAHPNDWQALRRYRETYAYDEVGNIVELAHRPLGSTTGGWTRRYRYAPDNNRLLATSAPGDERDQLSLRYAYDAAGNMVRMPHLPEMAWDYAERLQRVSKQVRGDSGCANDVYFVYDANGQRVRKVYEHGGLIEERIYLGGFELYRKRGPDAQLTLERESLHVMDDRRRVALIETKTIDRDGPPVEAVSMLRFQLENQLGSSAMELDETGKVVSYEEYFSYGVTAYGAVAAQAEVPAKRYRYTGKERDEETGLYYYGARYYAPWLGRWTSADPSGGRDGPNLYQYVHNNPIGSIDPNGRWTWGQAAVLAAVIVVAVVVTVATAGAAAPAIAAAASAVGATAAGATGAAAVTFAGTVAVGTAAGALSGAAADLTAQVGQNLISDAEHQQAINGDRIWAAGAGGAAAGGVLSIIPGAGAARAVAQVVRTGGTTVQVAAAIRTATTSTGSVVRQMAAGGVAGGTGGAVDEGVRQLASGEAQSVADLDLGRVGAASGIGFGAGVLGVGLVAGGRAVAQARRTASAVASAGDDVSHEIYSAADGSQRIRFRADDAVTLQEANPGRNMTTDTLAALTEDGRVFVHEGRHRAIGAARGDTIGADLGGIPDRPGWLDFEFTPAPAPSGGRPVRNLTIDNTVADVGREEADAIWRSRHGGS